MAQELVLISKMKYDHLLQKDNQHSRNILNKTSDTAKESTISGINIKQKVEAEKVEKEKINKKRLYVKQKFDIFLNNKSKKEKLSKKERNGGSQITIKRQRVNSTANKKQYKQKWIEYHI